MSFTEKGALPQDAPSLADYLKFKFNWTPYISLRQAWLHEDEEEADTYCHTRLILVFLASLRTLSCTLIAWNRQWRYSLLISTTEKFAYLITEAHVHHTSLPPIATLSNFLLGQSYYYPHNTPHPIISSRNISKAMRGIDLQIRPLSLEMFTPSEHTRYILYQILILLILLIILSLLPVRHMANMC